MSAAPLFAHLSPLPLRALTLAILGWELFLSVAIAGFGLALLRALGRPRLPFGLALVGGFSVWLFLGGFLNLFGVATRPVLIALLGCGALLFLGEARRPDMRLHWRRTLRSLLPRTPPLRLATLGIAGWLGCCLLAHMTMLSFNKYDDLPGYLAFAGKTAALGGLQPDPFSERRVTSGVGGGVFLDSTVLAGAPYQAVDFLEGTLGYLAFLLCLFALTRRFRLSQAATLFVFLAVSFLTLGRANLSSVNLAAASFFAILLLLLRPEPDEPLLAHDEMPARDAVLVGLLAGGALCLKSSNIPFCALLLLLSAVTAAWRGRSARPLVPLLLSGLTGVAFAVPWAIKHRLDEGTLLFPSLGRGDHLSAHGFPLISGTASLSTTLLASVYDLILPVAGGLLAFLVLDGLARILPREHRLPATPILAFFAAAAVAAPLFSISIAAADLDRFLLPVEVPSALLLVCLLLAAMPHARTMRCLWPAVAFVLLWAAGFGFLATNEAFYRDWGDLGLLFGHGGELRWYEAYLPLTEMQRTTVAVHRAQDAVPPGATLLELLNEGYAFDWKRNPVLIADYPGMSSPAGGMPLDGTPEQMRRYLLTQGIHFVVSEHLVRSPIDYAQFHRQPVLSASPEDIFVDRVFLGYPRMEYLTETRTRSLLDQLATQRRVLYDDGYLFVLGLD